MSQKNFSVMEMKTRLLDESDTSISAVESAVPEMRKVEDYTTFVAEYAFKGADIVIHFFQSREVHDLPPAAREEYWLGKFPEVFGPAAERYFRATRPRLVAQYVPEMTSWWMCCYGFASVLNPDALVLKFFQRLDELLDPNSAS